MADVKLSNKAKPDHPIRTPVRLRDDSSRPLTINLNQKKFNLLSRFTFYNCDLQH